ncbi:hypothetical protein V6N13_116719 [Hibiscus sabdariffa]|uniref:Uncharacterized protein n=1 Tax=Hibiscus sabdariffa TaxID=183260 RepID=A0ABR2QGY7_9ROSI
MVITEAEEGSGSRGCESRVRQPPSRRIVRIGRPSPGHRHRVAAAVRLWNEAQRSGRNGGCTVSALYPFVLQVLAYWVTPSDHNKALGWEEFTRIWKEGSQGIGQKVVWQKVFDQGYVSEGSEILMLGGRMVIVAEQRQRLTSSDEIVNIGCDAGEWLESGDRGMLQIKGFITKCRGDGVPDVNEKRDGWGVIWTERGRRKLAYSMGMEFFESQKVRGQRLKTITCLVRGGVRREKVRRDTWMVTRLRHAIRVSAWGTFHDRNDGGKKCGRLGYGNGPNDYLGQALIIWVGLRKQVVNNGLIMNSQNNGEQANDRRVNFIQWEKRIAMQAWVPGRVKRLGPHRRRKENLRRKKMIIIFNRGFAWANDVVLRSKEKEDLRTDVERGGPHWGAPEPLDMQENK